MKKFQIIIIILISAFVCAAQENKKKSKTVPDISGTWIFNKTLSSSYRMYSTKPIASEISLIIVQNEPEISFTMKAVTADGKESIESFTYYTDGRKMSYNFKLDRDNYVIIKWQGQKLVKNQYYILELENDKPRFPTENDVNSRRMRTKEVWELSKDGKTLTHRISGGYLNSVPISEIRLVYQRKAQ